MFFLLFAYIELSTEVTCCCNTAEATLGWSGMIEVMISPLITCCNWFSWIARAGTLMVKTRFPVSLACGGRVIWIGISFSGSKVLCSAGGPFCEGADDDADCEDVVGCPCSFLNGACRFFVRRLLFCVAAANGGTPDMLFAFPFIDDAAASAFFDFVPFACKNSHMKMCLNF